MKTIENDKVDEQFIKQFNEILDEQMKLNKELNEIQKVTSILKSKYERADKTNKDKIEIIMKEIESRLKNLHSKTLEINKRAKSLSSDEQVKRKKIK